MQDGKSIDKQQGGLKHDRQREDHGGGRREDGRSGVAGLGWFTIVTRRALLACPRYRGLCCTPTFPRPAGLCSTPIACCTRRFRELRVIGA